MAKKPTKAEVRAAQEQADADAAWLLELAEKGKAELDRRKQREP